MVVSIINKFLCISVSSAVPPPPPPLTTVLVSVEMGSMGSDRTGSIVLMGSESEGSSIGSTTTLTGDKS
jgi:hypothetical protein